MGLWLWEPDPDVRARVGTQYFYALPANRSHSTVSSVASQGYKAWAAFLYKLTLHAIKRALFFHAQRLSKCHPRSPPFFSVQCRSFAPDPWVRMLRGYIERRHHLQKAMSASQVLQTQLPTSFVMLSAGKRATTNFCHLSLVSARVSKALFHKACSQKSPTGCSWGQGSSRILSSDIQDAFAIFLLTRIFLRHTQSRHILPFLYLSIDDKETVRWALSVQGKRNWKM
jgi:hypothetical protein